MNDTQIALIAAIKALRDQFQPITGTLALGFAELIHEYKLDGSGQWGNAYFRCPNCGRARDCEGDEAWKCDHHEIDYCHGGDDDGDPCHAGLTIDALRLSEGWVERL
jgi:hypothetical protein